MAPAPAYADDAVYDVAIIGAGIAGINAAARIQQKLPHYKYTILEARSAMGGTWDLFRYPGIRSDSDLHTFGFSWRPWTDVKDIAEGDAIRQYIKDSAREVGVDKHIKYRHRLVRADWQSGDKCWRLDVDASAAPSAGGEPDAATKQRVVVKTRWILMCTGYYDYETPLSATIPGIESFAGKIIHPQFWPEELDYSDKKIAIVGSGATAITLLPVLARTAERVTMIQRSPSYIISRPAAPPLAKFINRWFPGFMAWRMTRWLNITVPYLFFLFCRRYPAAAKKALRKRTVEQLPETVRHDPHFQPSYNPWEQRLCVCPDADFFESLRAGKAALVTGVIDTVTANGIRVKGASSTETESTKESDTFVSADIIVTATGLKMRLAGGATVAIDGKDVAPSDKFLWKGLMLQDVPNMSIVMGYTNASWTLGADCTALQTCRILAEKDRQGKAEVVPRMSARESTAISEVPVLNLNSTYVKRGGSVLPKAGDLAPWQSRKTYLWDVLVAQFGSVRRGLQYL